MTKVLISGARGKLATHLTKQGGETEYAVMSLGKEILDMPQLTQGQ